MVDRLDMLLEEARPPEPLDDGFTELVMHSVRADADRRWRRRRRFFSRPAVLAAAAVLVTGGALAAVRSVTAPEEDIQSPSPASEEREAATAPSVPEVTASTETSEAPSAPVAGARGARTFKKYRDGDYEWGYTSDHTAYVLDHSTGLRLETESYTNSFVAGEARKVTVKLANTGKQALGIYSADGCALSVAAFAAEQRESDPAAFDPKAARDPSSASSWRCAGTETQTGGRAQKWVLAPGSSRTRDTDIVLPDSGKWSLVGMCQCEIVNPEETESDPLDGLNQLLVGVPTNEDSREPSYMLFTPPIRIQAS